MTSSCPRSAVPSFAVSALGETRMVSSWIKVPRWAWAYAAVEKIARKTMNPSSRNGKRGLEEGTPPPPWSAGIIDLEENLEKILVPQRLAGKILKTRDLPPPSQ